MAVLAIDQGTTSTRALRLDRDGSARVVKAVEHRQSYPQTGWVEHDPEELVANILLCLEAGPNADAIGFSNQGESCLAWDSQTKQPLSQVVVWQDSRTEPEIDRLKVAGAEADVLAASGLPLDSYFSASKLAWLYRTLPEARALHGQGRLRLGTTDAFFLDRLTGQCVTDIATASRTSLLNLGTGQWDPALCDLFGVPIEALPAIRPATGDFGEVCFDGRAVPVTASIVDQQAALYGHGCRGRGDAKVTFGTGAFALMVTGPERLQAPERGLLPTVAWQRDGEPPTYALDGGVYCASAAVNWARSLGLFATFDQINAFAEPAAIGRGIAFVPALAGLACPHWDRAARGLWVGLSLDTGPHTLVQAILEGVALRTAEVVSAMDALVPIEGGLSVDGGLVNNAYFRQFLADVLGRPVRVPSGGELTAIGTARLAAEAAGIAIAADDAATTIEPRALPADYGARFAEAVALSQQWAGSAGIATNGGSP